MFSRLQDSSRNLFDKLKDRALDVRDAVLGNGDINDTDSITLNSFSKPILKKTITEAIKFEKLAEFEENENNYINRGDIDCSRNLVITSSTLFRKGPVPIEFLSHQEQNRLSRRGCLKEWDDSNQATSDNHLSYENPSSKSLLSYFARLGSGEDDTDSVNLAFVESLLNAGASFNYPDVYGQSIFFAVVRDWNTDVAEFAMEKDADINHRDKYGRTPLHLAAAVNYSEMVDFLLLNGADITAKTYGEEQTPLHYAARYDSVEAMKVLIQGGAMIDSFDFLMRTPLQVASEIGSCESVKFLLKLGAPTGVYDVYGYSTMFLMVEKMPKLAYEGLNQFFVEDNSMRRRYYYLDHMEYDTQARGINKDARNVLQGIVMHKELDLIMHPAIQKLLQVKWKLFGKKVAVISNFENILYTLLATVLTYSFPYHAYDKQFSPVKDRIWKLVLAALFFILTFYFWIKQILFIRSSGSRDQSYKLHRLQCIKKQYQYAHPAWPEEKEYYDGEAERLQRQRSSFWQDPWNIFEWCSLLLVVLTFILHIVNIAKPDRDLFKGAKLVSAVSLLLIWFRLFKTLRIFKIFAELTVLLGHVITISVKFILLFMDFFIPYVFFFYMLFGGPQENAVLTKIKEQSDFTTIADVAYHAWTLTVKASYPEDPLTHVHEVVGQIAVGTYFLFMAVMFLFIYIGHLSEVFCRLHRTASANANLLVASLIINAQYKLSVETANNGKRYMRHHCGPMVVPFESSDERVDDRQDISIGIDHVTTKVDEITNFLGKASFPRDDKQGIQVDHLTVFHTDIEKLLQKQRSLIYDLETSKVKVSDSQKRGVDMIKKEIEMRTTQLNKATRKLPPTDSNSSPA